MKNKILLFLGCLLFSFTSVQVQAVDVGDCAHQIDYGAQDVLPTLSVDLSESEIYVIEYKNHVGNDFQDQHIFALEIETHSRELRGVDRPTLATEYHRKRYRYAHNITFNKHGNNNYFANRTLLYNKLE